MASFFQNLRESADQSNPDAVAYNRQNGSFLWPTTQRFGQKDNSFSPDNALRNFVEGAEERRLWRQDIDRQVKETTPLRNAIKEASGGRVLVDRSIYNKTALERILNTVKNMQEYNGGVLRPGYTVISNGRKDEMGPRNLGEAKFRDLFHLNFPSMDFQLFPSQNYGGKNAPYRVALKHANHYDYNDALARDALDSGWTIENFNDDDVESVTHAHELAHTAYFDALKKTQNPLLSGRYSRETIENFRQTHPSLQEIFDIAARNTGYDTPQDAAASISRYALEDAEEDAEKGGLDAKKNWSPNYRRMPEVFAEAYTDVLYNKDYASNYSKELIKLYTNYINDYNKTFGTKINLKQFPATFEFGKNTFVDNLRKSSQDNK